MKKRSMGERGITLVALIVTIIVLLILAGVTINTIFGENGLINKAKTAAQKYKEQSELEKTKLGELENWISGYGTNGESGQENVKREYYTQDSLDKTFIYTFDNKENTALKLKSANSNLDASLNNVEITKYGLRFKSENNSFIPIGEFNYNNFTVEVTFRIDELSQEIKYIIANNQYGGFGIYLTGTKIIFDIYDSEYKNIVYDGLESNKIYTVCAKLENSNASFYVDGEKVSDLQLNNFTYPIQNTILGIGADTCGNSAERQYFDGYIIAARGYSTALTDTQIKSNSDTDKYNYPKNELELDREIIGKYDYESDENTDTILKDLSGNNNDFTMSNATITESGIYSKGLTSPQTEIKGPVKYFKTLTFLAQFRIINDTGDIQTIISNTQGGGCGIYYDNSNKYLTLEIKVGGSYRYLKSKEHLIFNKVYTICATFDGYNIKLYLDGELQESQRYYGFNKQSSNTIIAIAGEPNGAIVNGNNILGSVYHAEIYERALSANEVNYIANLLKKNNTKNNDLDKRSILVSYNYNNVNNTSRVAKDLSDNGNDGRIVGATITNQGFYFNGSSYIGIKTFNLGKFTYMARFTPTVEATGEADIINDFQSGGAGIVLMGKDIVFSAYLNGTYRHITYQNYVVNQEYKAVLTYDGNTMKAYINDELIGTLEYSSIQTRGVNILIGAGSGGTSPDGDYFTGYVKDVKIFDRDLDLEYIRNN